MSDNVPGGRIRRMAKPSALAARTAAGRAANAARGLTVSRERREELAREMHEREAARYVAMFGGMKGAVMKLGQVLAFVESDLIPAPYRTAFTSLLADAPQMGPDVVEATIHQELGRPVDEVFASFDRGPLAAASIGQVHGAVLPSGERVAVKVQYPGVADAIEADLRNAEMLATYMRLGQSVMGSLGPRMDVRAFTAEIRDRILEEVDYTVEARNQSDFARWYEGHPFIRVPCVYEDMSTKRVLVTELAEGRRWEDALGAPEPLRQRWAEIVFRFGETNLYRLHATNGDPHPGNYLFRDDGTVVFLDFGFVKRYDAETVRGIQRFGRAHFDEDARALVRALVDQGFLESADAVDAQRVLDWMSVGNPWWRQRPFRISRDAVRTFFATIYAPVGEWAKLTRQLSPPPSHASIIRVDLGLWSVLAALGAENDWVGIVEEIWGETGPATPLGELCVDWYDAHPSSASPERTA